MAAPVESFFLSPDAQGTLQAQIQQMVAEAILSGRLRRGDKLPSTRKLARHLGVSRITVTLAYTELQANDYLSSRGRSGYYVSDNAPDPPAFPPPAQAPTDRIDWGRAIGTRFTGGETPSKPRDWQSYRYPFTYGQPDLTLFDHNNWRLCALKALGQKDLADMSGDRYDSDDPDLVAFIASQILPRRGILAGPGNIMVTMGAQNALWLTAQVLLTQRRQAVIEDPCYYTLRDVLAQSRCRVVPVPVDEHGMPPEAVPEQADVLFTTPSHQCPTSSTMPLARRQALLERAREIDALIVEDDYEFEMSFLNPPSPALKSLDREGRVIYVGSFSKSLGSGVAAGLPRRVRTLHSRGAALRATVLRHPPSLVQRTAAYFLSLGHFDAMIRRIGRAYHRRRQVMEAAIELHGLDIAGRGTNGGSSFWMRAPFGVDTEELARMLRARDVLIEPGAPFFAGADAPRGFYRIAYSSIPSERIEAGIARIGAGIRELQARADWT